MDSLRGFLDALQAFGERLAAVRWEFLIAAVALGWVNLGLRSRAWQSIIGEAIGDRSAIRYRTALGAYCAGVGLNSVLPARAGDALKMVLVRRRTPGAGYPMLAGTLVAETLFDFVIATGLVIWALQAGVLPGVRLPEIPAFEISLALGHPWVTLAILGVLVIVGLVLARRIRAFWGQFGQGLAIVRRPGLYLRRVALLQSAGWGCRVGAALCFLAAFSVPATLENGLIVQVAGSLGGLLPATPGGLGPKQALLVVMLAGTTGRTDVLAFSAGMEIALVVGNLLVGVLALALMARTLRIGRAISRARSDRAGPVSGPE